MKSAKEIIDSKVRRSREKFEFDESIVDSLSIELRATIGNAMPCNVFYTAYYVCKYREYNNKVLVSMMNLLDLSCYPEYWIEKMIIKISEYADNGGDNVNDYIRFLALYPQENAENTLSHCIDFVFKSQYDREQCYNELNMSKWELYYNFKEVKVTRGLVILKKYNLVPGYNKKFLFLKALWDKINDQIAELYSLIKKDPETVAKMFVEDVLSTSKKKLDVNMTDWYANNLRYGSKHYQDIVDYYERIGDPSTLDIYFEEV